MTTPLESPESDSLLLDMATLLEAAGCSSVVVRSHDGEIVIDGYVPSFEDKIALEAKIRTQTGRAVRNCLRVHPR